MNAVQKTLKDLFTEDDNQSADMIPVIAMMGCLVYLGMYIWLCAVKATLVFNGIEFGTGFSAMLATYGLAFKLKRDAQVKPMADAPAATVN